MIGGATTKEIPVIDKKYTAEERSTYMSLLNRMSSKDGDVKQAALSEYKLCSDSVKKRIKEFKADVDLVSQHHEYVKTLEADAVAARSKADASAAKATASRADATAARADATAARADATAARGVATTSEKERIAKEAELAEARRKQAEAQAAKARLDAEQAQRMKEIQAHDKAIAGYQKSAGELQRKLSQEEANVDRAHIERDVLVDKAVNNLVPAMRNFIITPQSAGNTSAVAAAKAAYKK